MRGSQITYTIRAANPEAHLFDVELVVENPSSQQVLSLPTWIPGSYLIREFSKNIVQIAASGDEGTVKLHRVDKRTWQAESCSGALVVKMQVYAWDLSVRTAHLDQTHGFFNPTSTCLKVHGQEESPCRVVLQAPDRPYGKEWKLATAMRRVSGSRWGFGTFEVDNYDELLDHPVEMGTFETLEFEVCGVPHAIVLTGRCDYDAERLVADVSAICSRQIKFFGEPAPMDRYLFLTMVVEDGYGGLEHRWSTALICRRDSLPQRGDDKPTDGYRTFLGLVSHEYFHSWNVKRIKPDAFTPYDLARENYTTLLWVFEGFTSYYDDMMLLRSERIDLNSYLELLGRTATRVWRSPGRFVQSVADSSFDAWVKFYRQDANSPNAIISYYTKGALIALCIDLMLIEGSNGKVSLDDVMWALWERHGQTGEGVTEEGVEALISEIAGVDMGDFFDSVIRTPGDVPVAKCLAAVGVETHFRPALSQGDKGGKPAGTREVPSGDLGARLSSSGPGVKVGSVRMEGPAQRAGLAAGDIIMAWAGRRATVDYINKALRRAIPGDTVEMHVFRREQLMTLTVTLDSPPQTTVYFTAKIDVDADVLSRRNAWLSHR